MSKVYRTPDDLEAEEIRTIYDSFEVPATDVDCGQLCAPNNPTGKPFCCDICHAIPAAYHSEWAYLEKSTCLWRPWTGNECPSTIIEQQQLFAETPASMTLLACLGPAKCERDFRALSCRQFPFFPYVTSDYRFLGLASEWEFADRCWVLQNQDRVTADYRRQFVAIYDRLFALFDEEFENYAHKSREMRERYAGLRRRFPLLHRNGQIYWVSPVSERLARKVS
ncbi:MAG TPA: hypothetical protein VMC09_07510 [Anaerolineales bacterium]|nr:hypothetical protein [Anaerolineales bacterium]